MSCTLTPKRHEFRLPVYLDRYNSSSSTSSIDTISASIPAANSRKRGRHPCHYNDMSQSQSQRTSGTPKTPKTPKTPTIRPSKKARSSNSQSQTQTASKTTTDSQATSEHQQLQLYSTPGNGNGNDGNGSGSNGGSVGNQHRNKKSRRNDRNDNNGNSGGSDGLIIASGGELSSIRPYRASAVVPAVFGSGRQVNKYCGLRNDDAQYIPLDKELVCLFEVNPLPYLPRNHEILPVLNEMELIWEDHLIACQPEAVRKDIKQINALITRKRRAGDFCPTVEDLGAALARKSLSLNNYLVPEADGLTNAHLNRLQTFIKNRMLFTLFFTPEFKVAVIRDALGIDKGHPAFKPAWNICTNMRSSLQAKILCRAHSNSSTHIMTHPAGQAFAKKNAGTPLFISDKTTLKNCPKLPDAKNFPESYHTLDKAMDVFSDIADGTNWDLMWKVPDPKKPNSTREHNHFGRSIILKTLSLIQAECLNALQWCEPGTGTYRRPVTVINGKTVPVPFNRCQIVRDFIRSIDKNTRVEIACPREAARRRRLEEEGHPIDPTRRVRKVGLLFPLPADFEGSRLRNGGDWDGPDLHRSKNTLVFDGVHDSDLEDNLESDNNESDTEQLEHNFQGSQYEDSEYNSDDDEEFNGGQSQDEGGQSGNTD